MAKKPTKAALEAYAQILELKETLKSLKKRDAVSLNDWMQRVHFTVMIDGDLMELDDWLSLNTLDLFDGIRVFLHSQHDTVPLDNDGIEAKYRPEMDEKEKSEK